jgi:hypothetical protein
LANGNKLRPGSDPFPVRPVPVSTRDHAGAWSRSPSGFPGICAL